MNELTETILSWYDENKRSLPWRDTVVPYHSLVSEVMLQQTRVETVLPYFAAFIEKFPDVEALAAADQSDVLAMWSGLGYYSRARNLHAAAQQIVALGCFQPPLRLSVSSKVWVRTFSGAIGSIAFGIRTPAVDGNHHRILARLFRHNGTRNDMWAVAERLLPDTRSGDFNQALMDIGSSICTARNPHCLLCPISSHCQAFAAGDQLDFPLRKKKKKVPTKNLVALVIPKETQFLMGQRPPDGLYGGLIEFPLVEIENASANIGPQLRSFWSGIELQVAQGNFRHVLSHMRLEIQVYTASYSGAELPRFPDSTYQQLKYVSESELSDLGVSTLATKF